MQCHCLTASSNWKQITDTHAIIVCSWKDSTVSIQILLQSRSQSVRHLTLLITFCPGSFCMNIILSLQSPGLIHALILELCMCSRLLFEQCFNMTSLWMPCHVDVSAAASRDAKLYFAFLPLTLKFDFGTTLCDSQGSVVIIVSRLWAGWSGVWILAGERDWSLLQSCI